MYLASSCCRFSHEAPRGTTTATVGPFPLLLHPWTLFTWSGMTAVEVSLAGYSIHRVGGQR